MHLMVTFRSWIFENQEGLKMAELCIELDLFCLYNCYPTIYIYFFFKDDMFVIIYKKNSW